MKRVEEGEREGGREGEREGEGEKGKGGELLELIKRNPAPLPSVLHY